MLKVAVRRIFLTTPQLYFARCLTSPKRKVSFGRSDFKCLRNKNVLSSYASRYVGLEHEGMVQPPMVTFNQGFASTHANFFAMVVGIIRL